MDKLRINYDIYMEFIQKTSLLCMYKQQNQWGVFSCTTASLPCKPENKILSPASGALSDFYFTLLAFQLLSRGLSEL